MKFTMPRRDNKHKKQRVRAKTKIRWQQLGFTDPAEKHSLVSMVTIRRQAVMMSSTGLEKAVRASATSLKRDAPHQRPQPKIPR